MKIQVAQPYIPSFFLLYPGVGKAEVDKLLVEVLRLPRGIFRPLSECFPLNGEKLHPYLPYFEHFWQTP